MKHYSVFGGHLRSEIVLPELPEVESGPADWILRVSTTAPVQPSQELLGEVETMESMSARLYRLSDGFRLEYDDTGTYDVLDNGAELVWYSVADAPLDLVQMDVLGRVLALAHHLAGSYCLHASAVSVAGQAIAFMAPKFHGKSTTAFSLVRAGAKLITDDTLAISLDPTPLVRPGIQTVRLWEDSAAAVEVDPASAEMASGKYLVGNLPNRQVISESIPLAALYLLFPVVSNEKDLAVLRTPLPSTHAALSMIAHSKLGALFGGSEMPVLLDRAAAITNAVPVYKLAITRNFERLPEVVAQIMEWHSQSDLALNMEAEVA